jgi:osmotically-inducible protein OsmY
MRLFRIMALVVAAALAGCTSAAKDRSIGQVFEDGAIAAKVRASIAEQQGVNPMSINVTTDRGVVQLSGFVESEEAKRSAENAANGVEGVRSVKNDLRIASGGASGRTK